MSFFFIDPFLNIKQQCKRALLSNFNAFNYVYFVSECKYVQENYFISSYEAGGCNACPSQQPQTAPSLQVRVAVTNVMENVACGENKKFNLALASIF